MVRKKSPHKGGGKKKTAVSASEASPAPGFYCETCGKKVPADVDACPYCGMPFYAVKCPRCGYMGGALQFVNGCPSCGYLSKRRSRQGESSFTASSAGKSGNKREEKKPGRGEMPGWLFFLVLLLLGTLLAGLITVYFNL
ncbi:MAG: hypothetical protein R6V67_07145 [Spirochaetia bacterium]